MKDANHNLALQFLVKQPQDRVAVVTDDRLWTYGEIQALASTYDSHLTAVSPGDRVILIAPDGPDYVAALFAILARGGVAVMINPELNRIHLTEILNQARAPIALIERRHHEALGDSVPTGTTIVGIDSDSAPAPANDLRVAPVEERDPALWLFSGGTTGRPKIVVQTHASFLNTTRRYAQETLAYQPDDRTLAVPRLFFGYATGSGLFFPFSVGASTVLFSESPTPARILEQIRRHRPSILITTPSAVSALLQLPQAEASDLKSLRFATSAGEALPESLYRRFVDRFQVELLDGLGTAEMWHIFVTNRLGAVRAGTVGQAVAGFRVEARAENGDRLAVDEVGLLWVQGDSGALGYFDQPELTGNVFRGDWVVTGDLISIDEDGFVTHRGRADDALKIKGKWLRPQEVESCLLEHPAVAEAAVVGVTGADDLVKPVAFVVAKGQVGEQELKDFVLARLEPYKHPRRVVFLPSLPVTHLGKVDRSALKRLASEA